MAVFVACAVFLCFVEGYAVNGMVNAARPHIEKQFGMTSSRSALITSAQDIGALCVVILVSYIGSNPQYNKARWVAVGSVLMAVGSLVFMVPHIILSASNVGSGPPPSGICDLSNSTSSANASDVTDPPSSSSSDLVHYLGVFMAANLLHGMGFCPMFTVGTVYIDENEKPNLAAVYIGMTYA
ncbi:solute carrier organic anion transporter family member 5A1, partial [Aplysia californica]|uniref:Solute carrier organic anion transporter family member 5A1 n=1 Tax=Aplysia californica TaxID=6500 RepID=A0ABM0ZXX7_APLCA